MARIKGVDIQNDKRIENVFSLRVKMPSIVFWNYDTYLLG